ncbi:hypothetical protein EMPS_02669 [Entomortierella parvispora]|uniref:Uncharacterized protein n=1 Tax=Entomortierella parvispora TaxID=205924 RepID=A0A9P3H558_9FUNG|nr:hypothetical protein EMPS_02669 [Entomortierella parvispora]
MSFNSDAIQARRPTTHDDDGSDSVSVPMLHVGQHEDEHENPFQHRPQSSQHQSAGHYNVRIPTVEHWPAILMQGVKATAVFAGEKLRQIQAYQQDGSSSGRYSRLPTSSMSSSSSGQRPTFTFGSKRQLRDGGGRTMLCSGRRLSRILLLLCITVLIPVWIFVVPHTLKPYGDRDVWIRYYDHEEPIKIQVPLAKKVHVADVKRIAFGKIIQGYSKQRLEEGKVFLISGLEGKLNVGAPWVNSDWSFTSSPEVPILMVDPGDELFRFLQGSLKCFSGDEYYYGGVEPVVFRPPRDQWQPLARILRSISLDRRYGYRMPVDPKDITYLREGFNDPKKREQVSHGEYSYSQKEERRNVWQISPNQTDNRITDPSMWDLNNSPGEEHEADYL